MQTTTLRQLIDTPGPFTSIYFDDSHRTEDAEKQLELKLRDLRDELSAQQAPSGAVAAIEAAVRGGPRAVGRGGRAVVAAGDKVVVDERLNEPPPMPLARVSELPSLLPLIRYGEPGLRHVVVTADRVEGRIDAFDEHGRKIESEIAHGREHPVHAVGGGGPAHHDMRERVEETIRRNVSDIADVVAKVSSRTHAELVILVGEVSDRRAVHEGLPKPIRAITHEATHESAVEDLVAGAKQRRLVDLWERFRGELGRESGLAAEGLADVTAALREANVQVLLVGDPGERTVFTGSAPTVIMTTEPELAALGATESHERRADEAVPLAAVAGGAELVSVDCPLADGFGAILRHS